MKSKLSMPDHNTVGLFKPVLHRHPRIEPFSWIGSIGWLCEEFNTTLHLLTIFSQSYFIIFYTFIILLLVKITNEYKNAFQGEKCEKCEKIKQFCGKINIKLIFNNLNLSKKHLLTTHISQSPHIPWIYFVELQIGFIYRSASLLTNLFFLSVIE